MPGSRLVLLLLLPLVLLAGCGAADTTAGGPPESSGVAPVPGDVLAEATAVRELPGGRGFAITVTVPAGDAGCAERAAARYDAHENRTHHVTTTVHTSGRPCPGTAERTVRLAVPVRGEDLALNHELWEAGPGATYVRCSPDLGCDPPADRCADTWTQALGAGPSGAELPPERRIDVVACAEPWLVADVDAVVTGCQSVDGAAPPSGCAGSGVHTRWFARLDAARTWQVVASGTAAGCADVADLPDFPTRLCRTLPARRVGAS